MPRSRGAHSGSACSALTIITILMMEMMIIDDAGYDTVLYLFCICNHQQGSSEARWSDA